MMLPVWLIQVATLAAEASKIASPATKPAVLFCSPQGADGGWVDLEYLKNLSVVEGINADLTTDWTLTPPRMNLSWSRVRQYNALVLFGEPTGIIGSMFANQTAVPPGEGAEFAALVRRFITAGGGVLMIPTETNKYVQQFPTLTAALGATLPLEQIVETDEAKRSELPRMAGQGGAVAHTSAITQGHAVTSGVRGLWYPTTKSFNGQMTGPIIVDERNWTVLVRGSPTSHTVPLNLTAWASSDDPNPLPPHPYQRRMNVSSPVIFAVRQTDAGRAALLSQFRQFTIGSGSRWLYDNVILSRGLNGLPSDQARLLSNTYRWLSEPSLNGQTLGGWTPAAGTYAWPNDQPANLDQYVDINNSVAYQPDALVKDPLNPSLRTFRGLIGAKTALSGGAGMYEEWASAAKAARLDFLIFLEDFGAFARNKTKFQEMLSQCEAHSTSELLLLPGYRLKNNLASGKFSNSRGNDMLFFGPKLSLPPPEALTADHTKLLLMPYVPNSTTLFKGSNGYSYNWLLDGQNTYNAQGDFPWTAGYFNLNDRSSPGGMSMVDLRDEGAAAVRYYAADGSEQNLLEDYLLTAESTMSSVPLAVSEVFSPTAMTAAVASGHALNYLRLSSLAQVMNGAAGGRGLRWNSQYSGTSVFVSDGPLIQTYSTPAIVSNYNTNEHRVMTLGSERFVTGVSVQPVSISANSSAPLRHVTIYSGIGKVFMRIRPNASDSHHIGLTLLLNGVLQKNLVLVVVDELNRTAVSFPFRSQKAGTRAPSFCSDHTNSAAMAKGPTTLPVATYTTALPLQVAGTTWDGGPSSIGVRLELLHLAETRPTLVSSVGTQLAKYFTQTPRLETSDEGSMAITSIQDRVISSVVVSPTNEWNTFGPIDGPAQLLNCTRRSIEWFAASIGHAHVGALSAWAIDDGMVANLIQSDLTFRKNQTVHSLSLMGDALPPDGGPVELVYALNSSNAPSTLNLSAFSAGESRNITLCAGAWFGLSSSGSPAAAHLYFVSGDDVRLDVAAPASNDWFRIMAPLEDEAVLAGDRYSFEMFAAGLAVNMGVFRSSDLLAIRNYVCNPPGLQILRGRRVRQDLGVLRVVPDLHSVAISVPRPPVGALPAAAVAGTILAATVPLQRNWSAGLWQLHGYSLGWYHSHAGNASLRSMANITDQNTTTEICLYTALGLDDFGEAHVPLYVGRADRTHVVIGHPVIAQALDGSSEGAFNSLRIQVTHVNELPQVWHVAVNNPTDETITAVLSQNMDLPGLQVSTQNLVLAPGEYRVLSN